MNRPPTDNNQLPLTSRQLEQLDKIMASAKDKDADVVEKDVEKKERKRNAKPKDAVKPVYLRRLHEINGGILTKTAKAIGMSDGLVSDALSLDVVKVNHEILAKALVELHEERTNIVVTCSIDKFYLDKLSQFIGVIDGKFTVLGGK